jgi:hypothetical protein
MIFFCSFFSYWRFKQFKEFPNEVNVPKFEMPELKMEELLFPEKEGYKEWVSPDGKLKLKYSANWIEINESFLKKFIPQTTPLKDVELLLVAQQLKIKEQALAFLTVEKINTEKSLNEILTEIKKNLAERGEIEIISSEVKDETAWLEMRIGKKETINFYSKEKIIFGKGETYLIAFITLEKDWLKFKKEASEIFDSIQITF